MKMLTGAICLIALCAAAGEKAEFSALREYLDEVHRVWKSEKNPRDLPEDPFLRWESRVKYRVVYAERSFFSFRAEAQGYDGGGHGWSRTSVGTICRGRRMELSDLSGCIGLELRWRQAICRYFETERWEECLSRSITPPRMTENFYADDAGLHFLYDPGTLAWRAAGIVDIFVPWTPEERQMPEKFSSLR